MVCWISGSVCAGAAHLPIALILPLLRQQVIPPQAALANVPPADREAAGSTNEQICAHSVVPARGGAISQP